MVRVLTRALFQTPGLRRPASNHNPWGPNHVGVPRVNHADDGRFGSYWMIKASWWLSGRIT